MTSDKEVSRVSTVSSELSHENSGVDTSGSSVTSVDSDLDETTTVDHSHGHRRKGKGRYHQTTESDYSGRSHTDDDRSGLSHSEGTSQHTGEASTLSSVSFTVVEYTNLYADNNDGAQVNILGANETFINDEQQRKSKPTTGPFDNIGGIEWVGDVDNEKIFGSSWMDNLFGGEGDDQLYGLEGRDWISGGDGVDQIFGAGGDDVIYTSYGATNDDANPFRDANGNEVLSTASASLGDGDYASGGSGNDKIYGA